MIYEELDETFGRVLLHIKVLIEKIILKNKYHSELGFTQNLKKNNIPRNHYE